MLARFHRISSISAESRIKASGSRSFQRCRHKIATREVPLTPSSKFRFGKAYDFRASRRMVPSIIRSSFTMRAMQNNDQEPDDDTDTNVIGSIGLLALWGGLLGYAFLVAPNQTPLRDMYFLQKLLNLVSDGVPMNAVFIQIFYIMGLWPLIYTALLIPAAKSKNNIPAWPFVMLSYGFGAFALLPFMALWQAPNPPNRLPPSKEDLEGLGNFLARGMESPILAFLLFVGCIGCCGLALTAGTPAWSEYLKLLEESRFVHVSCLFCPFMLELP